MDINCVIIDDEPNNITNLQTLLQAHCSGLTIAAAALNADDGIAAIRQHRPGLVFLDIQMPGKSGFEVLKAFAHPDFEVIFITAYDQYGIQAIKFSALDYLLKPIDIPELKAAVEKARQKLSAKAHDAKLENLMAYMQRGQKEVPKIALPTLTETRYIKIDEIARCEASDNYTTFFTRDEQLLVCKTLKDFAELLQPHGFVRTHQSHLVNIDMVKSLLKEDGGVLLMKDGAKVPISRQNRDTVKGALRGLGV
ncbi:LytR/AlgR family response regulator transcription factor [Mucilaginibacter myungsuensis]|uniref:Response regulator transcription factor n=1 Tax=Mucilaginibacter myungsuensis TaxID=649104 RepID=A0A929L0R1_9SPHI|nr:LytTR family DNA-binding domain-containing protein [Mucilaginibacter myungsuensis]MBE9661156.1 response regulator transcription factor [Mucilaginibacter myungsuensis]MDN3597301.1 LytTR family DNA-binding domain-containing protein [Mucilaginibacter myungsuensis]